MKPLFYKVEYLFRYLSQRYKIFMKTLLKVAKKVRFSKVIVKF